MARLVLAGAALGAAGALAAVTLLHDKQRRKSRMDRHLQWVRSAGFSMLQDELEVAVGLAVQCGEAMLAACSASQAASRAATLKGPSTQAQSSIDPQTATDLANEKLVMDTLASRFPGHDLIGEETTARLGRIPSVSSSRPTWIIDPIDGTQNFCHALPESCVSIGLCVGGAPELGVIYDPYRDELYVGIASANKAFLNGAKLAAAVSPSDTLRSPSAASLASSPMLDKAMVLTDVGYERSAMGSKRLAACHEALLQNNTFGIRIIGSTVLALAWLAAGRCSAVYMGVAQKDCPKAWDWCAAHAIGTAVGVTFLRLEEELAAEPFDLTSKSVCAARTLPLAEELRRVLGHALHGWAPAPSQPHIWGLE